MKDNKIDDLSFVTRAIHFAYWTMNSIGGGQQGIAVGGLQSRIFDNSVHLLTYECVLSVIVYLVPIDTYSKNYTLI